MRALEVLRRPWTAWAVLGLVALAAGLALLVPEARGPVVLLAPATSALLVVAGVGLHRPDGAVVWLVEAAALAALTAGQLWDATVLATVRTSLDGAAHLVAGAVVVVLALRSSRRGRRPEVLEVVVMCAVLGLAAAQAAVLLASSAPTARPALLASVDVVLLAFVVRMALTRRDVRSVASWCCVSAACALLLHDALRVGRLSEGASAAAVVVGVGLLGAAQLHPSARNLLDRASMAPARLRSSEVLGLLPLVVVPVGLRAVDLAVGGAGLPTWTHLLVGTVTGAAGVVRSWTALRGSEHLAEHDPLTDLPNRRGMARVFEDGQPRGAWALLLVDLDDFKDVNDAHGHDVGDALLLGVRDRLLAAVGDRGVVARFGGDEFAVLVRPGEETEVAEAVVASLRTPVVVGDLVLRTSASAGVAPAEAGTTMSELLTRADVALYAAKGAGRDTVRSYRPEQRAEVQQRYALSSQVRVLLAGRSPAVGRLEMHYQPLVELATGEVVGAEALVRWRHPEHGLLAPGAFLGHVSSSGLDADLDGAVLVDVLEQMGRWRDQRRRVLPVSVNLSRTSLLDPELAGRVREALARAGVPGSQLHVEITEHEPLPEDARILAGLRALRGLGIGVHLDDYGRGYTSLDYLQRFPVQVLKIDRSVVSGSVAGSTRLVAGIVAMSRTLRLDLLAEGVETEEQRRHLVAQGVRLGQGWLFSPALTAAAYAEQVLGPGPELPPVAEVPAPRLPLGAVADLPA